MTKQNNGGILFYYKIISGFLVSFLIFNFSVTAQFTEMKDILNSQMNDSLKTRALLRSVYALKDTAPEMAIDYVDAAENLARKSNLKFYLARSLEFKGNLYYISDQFSTALNFCYQSLALYENMNLKQDASFVLNSIANIYLDQGDIKKALDIYLKISEVDFQFQDTARICTGLMNIGIAYSQLNNDSMSLRYYLEAVDFALKCGEKEVYAKLIANIGILESKHREKFNDALAHLKEAVILINEIGIPQELGVTFMTIGDIYLDMKDYDTAINYYKQAQKNSEHFEQQDDLRLIFLALSRAYEGMGNIKESLNYYKKYTALNDTLFNSESSRKQAQTVMKYEIEKKEALLKASQKIKDAETSAEIKRQKLIKNVTLGGVGFAGFFSFLLVRSFNRRRKTIFAKQVSEVEMKALRAQMNPHFIFNSLHSINKFVMDNDKLNASSYLSDFAKLMRLILENSREQEVSLEKDLAALELYMQLESLRFQNKFRFSVEVDDELDRETTLIPPLLLQPFVENSILHGLRIKDDGHIKIKITKEDKMIRCIVEDNGIGREEKVEDELGEKKNRASLGMKITKERLEIINQQKKVQTEINIVDLKDADENPCGLRIEILLPLEEAF